MKRILLSSILIATALLVGCQKEPETSTKQGEFKVEKLFTTKEGCTVSRFHDDRTVYFTDCRGETSHQYSCGKNCTATDTVGGNRE